MNRREFLGVTAITASGIARMASAQAERPLRLLRDTTIDSNALNFIKGAFGTAINGQTFQQEALISFAGYQYATYFADGGVLGVARRKLSDAQWEVIKFADYRINHTDVHNVSVIGVCPTDGTLHLAFDHHVHALHYRRSVPGLALRPADFAWEAKLFGEITSQLEPGKPIRDVTYPLFFTAPQGQLQLVYRTGGSGNGDWFLAEYDGQKQAWQMLGHLFSRSGVYGSSESRCAYPNPIRYGPGNRLHVTWCWREMPKEGNFNLSTNHGVNYAFSDDRGRTWKNNEGVIIAQLGGETEAPISIASPGIQVWDAPFRKGMMNTTTQFVDKQGRVHVVNWQLPSELPGPNLDMNQWRYDHYWRNADGKWGHHRLPFHGRKPQIVLDDAGNAFLVFCKGTNHNYHNTDPGGDLCIATASEASGWTDWKIIHQQNEWFVGEPLLDLARWQNDNVLSIYIQNAPQTPGAPSRLRVIEFAPRETAA